MEGETLFPHSCTLYAFETTVRQDLIEACTFSHAHVTSQRRESSSAHTYVAILGRAVVKV